jgi:integrase
MAEGVRKRKNAKTWSYRFKKVMPDGSVIEKEKSGFKTQKEAIQARRKALAELDKTGTFAYDTRKRYKDVFEEFINNQGNARAYSTLKRYKSLYKNHVRPAFGDKFVYKITTANIEDFLIDLTNPRIVDGKQKVYSSEYLKGFWKLLKVTLDYAVKCNYINKNPMNSMSKIEGGKTKKEGQMLEQHTIALLSERFQSTNLYTAFYISFLTGIRCGEVFGLLWDDIDLPQRTISVNKQLQYQNGLWTLVPLKTKAAYRDILIPENLYIYLHVLYEKQQYNKKTMNDAYRDNHKTRVFTEDGLEMILEGLDFVNIKENGERLTTDSVKILPRIAREMGIAFKFHWLRHTHATMMAASGMEHEYLRKRLGHSKITTTLQFYTHESEKIVEKSTKILNKLEIPSATPHIGDMWDDTIENKQGGKNGGKFINGRYIPST